MSVMGGGGRSAAVVAEGTAADRRAAFDAFAAPHLAVMRRTAVVAFPAGDPDEVVQDALLRAWQRWSTYRPERGSARTWLLAITADRARRARVRARPLFLVELDTEGATQPPAWADGVDLRDAVRALPRRQREAVLLHYYVGLPVAEVAELMRCADGTVKSTLSDARANLAKVMGDQDE
jgi:RNA polymerase sigma-70 factor (ECF subfamily)